MRITESQVRRIIHEELEGEVDRPLPVPPRTSPTDEQINDLIRDSQYKGAWERKIQHGKDPEMVAIGQGLIRALEMMLLIESRYIDKY